MSELFNKAVTFNERDEELVKKIFTHFMSEERDSLELGYKEMETLSYLVKKIDRALAIRVKEHRR